jgi:hypothetical protein
MDRQQISPWHVAHMYTVRSLAPNWQLPCAALRSAALGALRGNMLAVHYVVHITGRRIDKPGRRQRAEGSSCK